MKNRIITIATVCLFLLTSFAFAAGEGGITLSEPKCGNSVVSIKGIFTEKKIRPITVQFVKPYGTLGNVEDIYRIDEIVTDGNGEFEKTVTLSDSDTEGRYSIYAGGRGIAVTDAVSFPHYWAVTQRSLIEDELNTKTAASDIAALLDDAQKADVLISNGCFIERYHGLPSDELKGRVLTALLNGSLTLSNTMEIFNTAVSLADINSFTAANEASVSDGVYDVFIRNSDFFEIAVGENVSTSDWLGRDDITSLLKKLMAGTEYTTIPQFVNAYRELSIVTAFNKALWTDMEHLLTINNDYLNLDLTYGNHPERATTVAKSLVMTYTSTDGIISAFNTAVETLDNNNAVKSPGPSGGGGGGRGTTIHTSTNIVAANPAVPQNTGGETSENPLRFADISETAWAEEYINLLADKDIVSGSAAGRFEPNRMVLRQEFVKMLVLSFGIYDKDAVCDFSDVNAGDWYSSYIASAVNHGAVQGTEDGRFGVDENISRQDMAVLIVRLLGSRGITISETNPDIEFSDSSEIADYAASSVRSLCRAGIISGMGDGTFSPQSPATRAQSAKIIGMLIPTIEQEVR